MAIIKKFRIKSFKNMNSIIEFKNVTLSYGKRIILDNINFKINESQIFGMLGPNGVGKSTIFNLITGLKNPNYGEIIIDGINTTNLPINERFTKLLHALVVIVEVKILYPFIFMHHGILFYRIAIAC